MNTFEKTNNKTIAQNTVYLYFNMMVTIVVSLYTSRLILKVLGVDDFGIYQTVGGVVGILSFLNAALGMGSSRFLTYELGTGSVEKLKKTFSTILVAHIVLALGITILSETIGLWFVYNKLVIPPGRMHATVVAYHLSVVTSIFHLIQVPYTATIISHEKMRIYAYISVVDAIMKLFIAYMLIWDGIDKLIMYSIFICFVSIVTMAFYYFYCHHYFVEVKTSLLIDRTILKEVVGYSGWNLFANSALALNNYGSVILLNIFFCPGVVTARAVANQVNLAACQFINNFRTAATPQIVKRYAVADYAGSRSLLLSSTKYSFYMMLLLALPIFVVSEELLKLWLGQIPPYSVIFLQLTIVCSLFQVFDTSFYTALYAKGQIRENALISPTILFISFPIVYLLFKIGCSPEAYAWVSMVSYALLAFLVKPILIIKIVGYNWKEIMGVFYPCLKVAVFSSFLPLIIYCYKDRMIDNTYIRFIFLVILSFVCTIISILLIGLKKNERLKMRSMIASRINKFEK